jgi:hypothetical protein
MSDSSDFKRKRKNVIGISLVIILIQFYSVELEKLKVFDVSIPVGEPFEIKALLFIVFGYLVYRYKNEWRHSEKSKYEVYMYANLWVPIGNNAGEKIKLKYDDEVVDSQATISNIISNNLKSIKTRYIKKISLGFLDRKDDGALVQNALGTPISKEVIVIKSIFNGFIFPSYLKYVIKNIRTGKYTSEYYLPKVFVITVYFIIGYNLYVRFF